MAILRLAELVDRFEQNLAKSFVRLLTGIHPFLDGAELKEGLHLRKPERFPATGDEAGQRATNVLFNERLRRNRH